MSQMIRLSPRIYALPFSKEADRPNLFYLRGDDFSVAIDAGNVAVTFTKTCYIVPLRRLQFSDSP